MKLYALPYYATTDTLKTKGDMLVRSSCAPPARAGPTPTTNRDKAVELLVKEFPNLDAKDEREAVDDDDEIRLLGARPRPSGWGTMDPAVWQDQIDLYAKLGQFSQAHAEARRGDDARRSSRPRPTRARRSG